MKTYRDITEARAYLSGHRKDPMLDFIYKAQPILKSRIGHYRAVLDRPELLNSKHKLRLNNSYSLASIKPIMEHYTYLARLFKRIDLIEHFIKDAEAEYKYHLTAKQTHALIQHINDNVIDPFLKKSSSELIRKLSLKQLKI